MKFHIAKIFIELHNAGLSETATNPNRNDNW
jgi:hypothetical protein